jgi:hypothetical protein
MKQGQYLVRVISLIVIILMSAESGALMVGMSTERLTRESELVIVGDVENTKSQWSDDGKQIVTRVTIIYTDIIKGKHRNRNIVVEHEGGEVEGIGMGVSDSPHFRKGDKVILFLKPEKRKEEAVFKIVGSSQGKYTVGTDGIARKNGFSLWTDRELIDNDIPADMLIDKIKRVK